MKKKQILLSGIFTLSLMPVTASAMTFTQALQTALQTNPTLLAQQQEIESVRQSRDIAFSGYRPNIGITAKAGMSYNDTDVSSSDTLTPWGTAASVTQPLYTGGTTAANIKIAELNTQAIIAQAESTRQTLLLQTAKAYLDVLRYQRVIELNEHNEKVLSEQLIAEQEKFKLGNSTRTDVAQSESRLAASRANLEAAKARFDAAKAGFVQLVGQAPSDLTNPDIQADIPASHAVALGIAMDNNPLKQAYQLSHEAAKENIESIAGENRPRLNLVGAAGYNEDVSSQIGESKDASVTLNLTVPLYQSGSVRARKLQAMTQAEQKRVQIDETERQIAQNLDTSWADYNAVQSVVAARQAQVDAAAIALEGVREEEKIGSRTTLDVLDAEQEYLDAQVSLVEAEFDRKIAVLSLLRSMGNLKIELLGL